MKGSRGILAVLHPFIGSTPVYRLYNPNAKTGTHHYTKLASERDHLKKVGWRYEGVAFYSSNNTPASKPTHTTNSTTKPKQPTQDKWVFIAWYKPDYSEDASYEIKRGDKVFATQAEATKWIDQYSRDVLVKHDVTGNWGTIEVKESDIN